MHPLLDGLAVWFASAVKPAQVFVDGVAMSPPQLAGGLLRADGADRRTFPPELATALARHLGYDAAAPDPLTWEEAATAMTYAFAGNADAARAHLDGLARAAQGSAGPERAAQPE